MSNSVSLLAIVALVLVWAGCVWILRPLQSRRNLQRQFRAAIEPDGPFVQCKVRFAPDEGSTPCIAKATRAGLYMVSPKETLAKRSWLSYSVYYLTEPVLIPWSVLKYRRSIYPLWGGIKFDVPSAKATFYIRRKLAIELLRQGGQPIP